LRKPYPPADVKAGTARAPVFGHTDVMGYVLVVAWLAVCAALVGGLFLVLLRSLSAATHLRRRAGAGAWPTGAITVMVRDDEG
jgi:hypothetical protein